MWQIIRNELLSYSQAELIEKDLKFFQCYPGGYGEGDSFAGVKNPTVRMLSKKHKNVSIEVAFDLLTDPIHEIRLLALFILDLKYNNKKTQPTEKELIAKNYLTHLKFINNWDLVDSSAHFILGPWAFNTNSDVLFNLSKSPILWENRVAIIATFYHIRQKSFDVPLQIALTLLHHPHDLIHKAVGWMLREIGNRNLETELIFLRKHYKTMPRTMLRYAIEKFNEPLRLQLLKGTW
ncbi:MAG: DNA alkylation repair protein [Salinivirgaceae bacterium]|jgi:3-methyladenine DNA glycosylase AlkD